ncbi:hypothetical protein [Nitrosomonas sp. wSCUT-2]
MSLANKWPIVCLMSGYRIVTGLYKLDIKEQDYSLNPGRYVGVVIEEDGKSEEEFAEELAKLTDEFVALNQETVSLERIIVSNIRNLIGE